MLENIGFYTLSDERARTSSALSPLMRCELILTGRCNFRCPYCRSVGGRDMSMKRATDTLALWIKHGLRNVRFSGGEPTLYAGLLDLVAQAKTGAVERIAISTNGSADMDLYRALVAAGANDFSVSLDACCSEDGDRMAGGRKGAFERVESAVRELSRLAYTTVGVVLTADNQESAEEIIRFADTLGVHDIRVIPAAQHGSRLPALNVPRELWQKYPILNYRLGKFERGEQVRGLSDGDSKRCGLVLDDMAVMSDRHYPCIIYLREGGEAIGKVGAAMRDERERWSLSHDCLTDPICSRNCLDVCRDFNDVFESSNVAGNRQQGEYNMAECTETPNHDTTNKGGSLLSALSGLVMCDSDHVIFWFSPPSKLPRGAGKRSGGTIVGGMGARVHLSTRIETTIAEMKKNLPNIKQRFVDVRYFDVSLSLSVETELPLFLASPREFTAINVLKRLANSPCF